MYGYTKITVLFVGRGLIGGLLTRFVKKDVYKFFYAVVVPGGL